MRHDKKHLLALVQQRKHLAFEDVGAHQRPAIAILRSLALLRSHPVGIVVLDEFCETVVGILFLGFEHLGHAAVGAAQFQFPVHQQAVDLHEVVECLAGGDAR